MAGKDTHRGASTGNRPDRQLHCEPQRSRGSGVSSEVAGRSTTTESRRQQGIRRHPRGGVRVAGCGRRSDRAAGGGQRVPESEHDVRAARDSDHVPRHRRVADRVRAGRRFEQRGAQRRDQSRLRRAGRELHPQSAVRAGGDGYREHRAEHRERLGRELSLRRRLALRHDQPDDPGQGARRIERGPALPHPPGSDACVDHGEEQLEVGLQRGHLRDPAVRAAAERSDDPRPVGPHDLVPDRAAQPARGRLPRPAAGLTARADLVAGILEQRLGPRPGDDLQQLLPADRDRAGGQRAAGDGPARVPGHAPG